MREILADLVAEQQYLDQSLQRSPDRDWRAKSPVKGWNIQDTIAHLAWSEERAARTLQGDLDFLAEAKAYDDIDAYIASGVTDNRGRRPQEIIEWWRHGRADVVDALSRSKPTDRVAWLDGDMSVMTFASGRIMETWAHGLDILGTLDKEIEDAPRLRHIARLGWLTLPWAFELADEEYAPVRVELVGPGYARYVFGPEGAENIVRGNAGDWCRVVVRRMKAKDAENLTATGPVAEKALVVGASPPVIPRLIGMVHLGPLPGAPSFAGDLDAVVAAAVADVAMLIEAGFGAVMVENFGDAPFFADDVPAVTVSVMTRCILAVTDAAGGTPVGVNVLRNDGLSAVAIAAVTGAAMVRVNVVSGTMYTDQGPITGRSAELARLRASLGADISLLADVMVKHATPPPGLTIADAARDTWERGGADALVVSGVGTGHALDLDDARAIRAAVPDAPLVAGSGTSPGNVADILEVCDAVIVGTAIKAGGVPTGPVHRERAKLLVQQAGRT